jgi:hypothetical protein
MAVELLNRLRRTPPEPFIYPTEPEHLDYIAEHLRESDRRELAEGSYSSPRDALFTGLSLSDCCFTAIDDAGNPGLVFGVTCIDEAGDALLFNIVWMLGTDAIERQKIKFLRYTRKWTDFLCRVYGRMGNYVASWNTDSIRWLMWCGFRVAAPAGFLNSEPKFVLMIKDSEKCATP